MIAYFDYSSTSYKKPKQVYKALKTYKKYGINIGRGKNKCTSKCEHIIEMTRQMLKDLVKADDTYQTIFQPSATYSLNLLIKGLDYSNIKTVYISKFEHNSVTRPLYEMQKQYNFEIIYLEDYEQQFAEKEPNLVIMSHLTNTFGMVQDYENVFKSAKKYNAITILDMAQSFGLIETNITRNKADAVVFAGHKTLYAFSGIGGIILNNSLKLKDIIQGGTGIKSADIEMPKERPIRFEAGTQNILGIFSLYYACKYLKRLTYSRIQAIEEQNYNTLKSILSNYGFFKIIEPQGKCSTIIACQFKDYPPENFANFFCKNRIAVRIGLQCSPNAHKEFGTFPSGTIRFSVGLFNKQWEFKKLDKVLQKLKKTLMDRKY